jgi:hypothetical protein
VETGSGEQPIFAARPKLQADFKDEARGSIHPVPALATDARRPSEISDRSASRYAAYSKSRRRKMQLLGAASSTAGLHQIAKDSDSGSLALSGLLSSPDLWEI